MSPALLTTLEGLGSIISSTSRVWRRRHGRPLYGTFWDWRVYLVTRNVLFLMIRQKWVSWIPHKMVGIRLESGRIPPKAARLTCLRRSVRLASKTYLSYFSCFIQKSEKYEHIWTHEQNDKTCRSCSRRDRERIGQWWRRCRRSFWFHSFTIRTRWLFSGRLPRPCSLTYDGNNSMNSSL